MTLPAQTQDSYIVSASGKDIYWSRGNGWVFVALARVLDILPTSDPHRDTYVADFKAMAKAIVPLQRSDGFWNENLIDPPTAPASAWPATTVRKPAEPPSHLRSRLGHSQGPPRPGDLRPGPAERLDWPFHHRTSVRRLARLRAVHGALPCTEDSMHPGRLGPTQLATSTTSGLGASCWLAARFTSWPIAARHPPAAGTSAT